MAQAPLALHTQVGSARHPPCYHLLPSCSLRTGRRVPRGHATHASLAGLIDLTIKPFVADHQQQTTCTTTTNSTAWMPPMELWGRNPQLMSGWVAGCVVHYRSQWYYNRPTWFYLIPSCECYSCDLGASSASRSMCPQQMGTSFSLDGSHYVTDTVHKPVTSILIHRLAACPGVNLVRSCAWLCWSVVVWTAVLHCSWSRRPVMSQQHSTCRSGFKRTLGTSGMLVPGRMTCTMPDR